MKKIRTLIKKTEAYKIILWAFSISLFYILLYELVLTRFSSNGFFNYKLGIVTSRICYSIVATSIFYFLSQYIPVYLPRQRRKVKILHGVFLKTRIIETRVQNLKFQLGVHGDNFYEDFFRKTIAINSDKPVAQFENWHLYLYHLKTALIDIIRSMTIYNDFLSLEFMEELTLIEYQLLSLNAFEGLKMLQCTDLSYAHIQLQEILIHNKHLQDLKATEFAKYEKIFKTENEAYRRKYFP
jgi:hypothetical protein